MGRTPWLTLSTFQNGLKRAAGIYEGELKNGREENKDFKKERKKKRKKPRSVVCMCMMMMTTMTMESI